jgi:hypothetical protein
MAEAALPGVSIGLILKMVQAYNRMSLMLANITKKDLTGA